MWLWESHLVFAPCPLGSCIRLVSSHKVVLPPVAAVLRDIRLVRSLRWPSNARIADSPQLHIPRPRGILASIPRSHNTPIGLIDARGTRLDRY